MGSEFIGECPGLGDDPESDHLETELAIKYIKQACGEPPSGVDVEVTMQDHELGSYPVISVVWDDSVTGYPDEYIGKCIEAFERFDLPEEIHRPYMELLDAQVKLHELIEEIRERRSEATRLRPENEGEVMSLSVHGRDRPGSTQLLQIALFVSSSTERAHYHRNSARRRCR